MCCPCCHTWPCSNEGWGAQLKYLVTGALGFIGFHLSMNLAKEGHDVVAVDIGLHPTAQEQLNRLKQQPGVTFIETDLNEMSLVRKLPPVDGVYHLAALNGTQKFYSQPWRVVKHSTVPTINLLEVYSERDIQFFFYAGSSEAYASTVTRFNWPVPTSEEVPLSIEDPQELRWSYGASKMHGEIACFAAASELKVPIVVGRFHNAYGPFMGNHHVIPDFIERGKRGVFELFGAENTRSFIYIDDAIEAVKILAHHAVGEVVNIGSPLEMTMTELAQELMLQAGWVGTIIKHSAPSGSVLRRAPDVTKLGTYMDTSAFLGLREGLRLTLQSYGVEPI